MQDEKRHFLARVIGSAKSRIVAVIGGDDDEIVRRERSAENPPSQSSNSRNACA